ncbi:GntR family transcriptional regulator [Kiloniella sp. b19]|uniref:GntR family transcriptional regulator n=1 Tax=Kiloniella sp. GXU_MW_B19 TaxID=3141326 RepID=UPI0031D89A9B
MTRDKTAGTPYAELRTRIISMDLLPGQDLEEQALVKEYGVSRTPVREALIRLSAEGLVQTRKNRSAIVAPLDFVSLRAYFEANTVIQRSIIRLAAQRRTKQDLAVIETAMTAFEEATAAADRDAMNRENYNFHNAIANASHNQYLIASYLRLLAEHQRIGQLIYQHNLVTDDQAAQALVIKQHRAIFDALRDKDALAAETHSQEHTNLCKEDIAKILLNSDSTLEELMNEDA